jgi:hypothetical protein
VPAHRRAAGAGEQVAVELEVLTENEVDVTVTVDVCFKNVGRTACKIVLKKRRFPAAGCAYEP